MIRSLLLNQQPAKTPNKYFWNASPLFERYSQKTIIISLSQQWVLINGCFVLKTADRKTANIKKCMLMFYDPEDYYVYLYSMNIGRL